MSVCRLVFLSFVGPADDRAGAGAGDLSGRGPRGVGAAGGMAAAAGEAGLFAEPPAAGNGCVAPAPLRGSAIAGTPTTVGPADGGCAGSERFNASDADSVGPRLRGVAGGDAASEGSMGLLPGGATAPAPTGATPTIVFLESAA